MTSDVQKIVTYALHSPISMRLFYPSEHSSMKSLRYTRIKNEKEQLNFDSLLQSRCLRDTNLELVLLETKEKYAARPYGEQSATNADGPGTVSAAFVRLCNRVAEKAMPRCVALGHTRPIICLTSKHYRAARDCATCQQRRDAPTCWDVLENLDARRMKSSSGRRRREEEEEEEEEEKKKNGDRWVVVEGRRGATCTSSLARKRERESIDFKPVPYISCNDKKQIEDAPKLNLLLIVTITLLNVRVKRILQKCYFEYWIYNAINVEMLSAIDIMMKSNKNLHI
ncbi:hypothetical protein G5I_03577 [Acromyrmex echinatior]|uniref:Uncharacterized protein n=1 Tax=Acromyrmex echinatior TaxID=103372 RepID=F4WDC4_ACREC|nr:hypothetical protein G5I_03577 [Acromyrmex echinatior]